MPGSLRELYRRSKGPSRSDFIGGSFASSAAVIAQASKLFSNNDRKKVCLLKFHSEWQHKHCPVMDWYKLQRESPGSTPESTTFRSIQHRRDSDPPFFHEFILLVLDNGDVYRIERTGQGSRVDAIRLVGCTANDYIQYFPASDYEEYTKDKPSELVAEINFPCTFDVMDVLAICYSIYKSPRTRIYTLQRFNCYFLCGTILLALTRRLTRWHDMVTSDKWKGGLQQSIDQLRELSRDPASEHLVLHACHLLEPQTKEPAGFMVDALHNRLASPEAFESLKKTLSQTLWRTTWPEYMNNALEDHVKTALATALEGDGDCAKALKIASTTKRKAMKEKYENYPTIENIYNKKAVDALADGLKAVSHAAGELYRMEQIEHPNSFLKEAWLNVAARVLGVYFPIQMAMDGDLDEWGFKDIFLRNLRGIMTAQSVGFMQARRLLGTDAPRDAIAVGKTQSIDTAATAGPLVVQANYDMAQQSLRETLKELADRGLLTLPNITIALQATLCKNIWDVWLNKSIADLLGSMLPEMLEDEEEGVVIQTTDEAGAPIVLKSVSKYQEIIYQRIEAHATRVEAYHLAAAALVKLDLRDAITTTWIGIPEGFSSPVFPRTEPLPSREG